MRTRLPPWLRKSFTDIPSVGRTSSLVGDLQLNTVCQEARCPNLGECFAQGNATFLLLGNICTRNCRFCAIEKGKPSLPDIDEPRRISEAVSRLRLRYVVLTSVTRDDLPDGGAAHFAETVRMIQVANPETRVEVLVPDFGGSARALQVLLEALPSVVAHNIETVPRLYPAIRPKANYRQSLNFLQSIRVYQQSILTKSGLMLGLGETSEEVIEVMSNLREADCDFLTLGQYLRPSPKHHKVARYIHPGEFDQYARIAKQMGFKGVASGPWVRSSFNAVEMYRVASPL